MDSCAHLPSIYCSHTILHQRYIILHCITLDYTALVVIITQYSYHISLFFRDHATMFHFELVALPIGCGHGHNRLTCMLAGIVIQIHALVHMQHHCKGTARLLSSHASVCPARRDPPTARSDAFVHVATTTRHNSAVVGSRVFVHNLLPPACCQIGHSCAQFPSTTCLP